MVRLVLLAFVNVSVGAGGQIMLKAGMIQVEEIGIERATHPLVIFQCICTTLLILAASHLYGGALVEINGVQP